MVGGSQTENCALKYDMQPPIKRVGGVGLHNRSRRPYIESLDWLVWYERTRTPLRCKNSVSEGGEDMGVKK